MSLLDTASLIITPNGYKEGTLYSVIPNTTLGDMTVVRATTATRVNSAGLIELVPYNLLTYSEQFDNADWAKYRGDLVINSEISPSGIQNADTFTSSIGETIVPAIVPSGISFIGNTRYSESLFVKKIGTTNSFILTYVDNVIGYLGGSATYNVSTQVITISQSANNSVTASMEDYGNGWYRLILNFLTIAIPTYNYIEYSISTANTANTFAIWGAQFVEGTLPKDYVRTETRLNIPRLDYSNGTCPSLLVEPQRTNVIQNSNAISGYFFSGVAVINAVTSPEGITNAFSFDVNNNTFGGLSPITLTTSAQSYTFSVYLKGSVNSQKVKLYGDLNGTIQEFTLTTSWERYTKTFTGAVGAQSIYLLNGSYFSPAQNDLYYGYGLQLEVGDYATSLIPTTSASVTRNADQVYKTGISSLLGQTEGTIFIDFDIDNILSQTINPVIFSFSGLSYIRLFTTGEINYYESNSVAVASSVGIINNGQNKIAVNYKNNDFSIYANGVLVGSNNSGAVVAKSQIGLYYLASINFNPSIFYNLVALFPNKLTGAECISLTT